MSDDENSVELNTLGGRRKADKVRLIEDQRNDTGSSTYSRVLVVLAGLSGVVLLLTLFVQIGVLLRLGDLGDVLGSQPPSSNPTPPTGTVDTTPSTPIQVDLPMCMPVCEDDSTTDSPTDVPSATSGVTMVPSTTGSTTKYGTYSNTTGYYSYPTYVDVDIEQAIKMYDLYDVYDLAFTLRTTNESTLYRSYYLELPKSRLNHLFMRSAEVSLGDGQTSLFRMPLSEGTAFEFHLASDNKTIQILKRDWTARELDDDTDLHEAIAKGNQRYSIVAEFMPTAFCEAGTCRDEDTWLFDISSWIVDGFGSGLNGPEFMRILPMSNHESIEIEVDVRGYIDFWAYFFYGVTPHEVKARASLMLLPHEDDLMTGRAGDDRAGFFEETFEDIAAPLNRDIAKSVIHRWRLEQRIPGEAPSEVRKPIKFHIDPTVPVKYRQALKTAVENWNVAFLEAGYINAVRAVLPGDDDWPADYDGASLRYSSINWSPSLDATFGFGPSDVDPRTGEIVNADIIITNGWVRYYDSRLNLDVSETGTAVGDDPIRRSLKLPLEDLDMASESQKDAMRDLMNVAHLHTPEEHRAHINHYVNESHPMWGFLSSDVNRRHEHTHFQRSLVNKLSLLHTVLVHDGRIRRGDPVPDDFVNEGLVDVVMHEVGHTLGLRHNFRASAAYSLAEINSPQKPCAITASVMDYTPINIPSDRSTQGNYFQTCIGPYDIYAIKYGYMWVPRETLGVQAPELKAFLSANSAKPENQFASDYDFPDGSGEDPLVNVFDLTSDPVEYFRDRLELVHSLWPTLADRTVAEGEPWTPFLDGGLSLMSEAVLAAYLSSKFIGGNYLSKVHRGDTGADDGEGFTGVMPVTVVETAKQQAALDLVVDVLMTDTVVPHMDSFHFMVQRVGWLGLSSFPIHSTLYQLRGQMLVSLFDPARMSRVRDNAWITMRDGRDEPFHMYDVVSFVDNGIWNETFDHGDDVTDPSFTRDVQSMWIDFMMMMNEFMEPETQSIFTKLVLKAKETCRTRLDIGGLSKVEEAHYQNMEVKITRYINTAIPPGGVHAYTVICTELHRQGFLTDEQLKSDLSYGRSLRRTWPRVYKGYLVWGRKWVEVMQQSRLATSLTYTLARHWVRHMEFVVGDAPSDDLIGMSLMGIGAVLSVAVQLIVEALDQVRTLFVAVSA